METSIGAGVHTYICEKLKMAMIELIPHLHNVNSSVTTIKMTRAIFIEQAPVAEALQA
jgi:hypothetical protein